MEKRQGDAQLTNSGKRIFEKILADLKAPKPGLSYEVRLVWSTRRRANRPNDYVVRADNHGVPQNRHR